MQKTFITRLPEQTGAFLDACRMIWNTGACITRVSYNKAVDTHTLFLDADGTEDQLSAIAEALRCAGYLLECTGDARVMLLDFALENRAGSMLPVLELIDRYGFGISYLDAAATDQPVHHLKLGLFVEDEDRVRRFLREASERYEVRVIRHEDNGAELDRAVFYIDFVNHIIRTLHLARETAQDLMAYSNTIMQNLAELNEPPQKTFQYIARFAELLAKYRGDGYLPCVEKRRLADGFYLHSIQPPCGSNTWILQKGDDLLFIDCGFALYADEMHALLHTLFPDFDRMRRSILLTHPDMDHSGLLRFFDTIYVSPVAHLHFELENAGKPAFREQDRLNAPYCGMARILTGYQPPKMEALRVVNDCPDDPNADICRLGQIDFCGRQIDIYRGNGGHARGEIVAVDEADGIVFCGDIFVNAAGFSPQQLEFNQVAPYLLTSVNLNSALASRERRRLIDLFPKNRYAYCCGHGAIMDVEA